MSSKLEENIRKHIRDGVMSPNWFKKKKYRITYALMQMEGKRNSAHQLL